jgi:hypothetical protein
VSHNVKFHILGYREFRTVQLIFPFGLDISAERNQGTQHIPLRPNVSIATQSRTTTGHWKQEEKGRKELITEEERKQQERRKGRKRKRIKGEGEREE